MVCTCTDSIFQSLSLNVRRLVSLQEIMAPIQSTFLSFHNEFHGNSIPSLHISNVNELGLILLTKWSHDLYRCTNSIFQYLFNMKRLTSLQENMGPIHSTFYSFCNEFHEKSLQWIHNWEGEHKNEMTKWTRTNVIDQMKYIYGLYTCTNSIFQSPSLNTKRPISLQGNMGPIHSTFPWKFAIMNSQLERWTTSEWLSELRLVLLTMWGIQFVHMWFFFFFHLFTNTYRIEK
jgi:hypothetical protein